MIYYDNNELLFRIHTDELAKHRETRKKKVNYSSIEKPTAISIKFLGYIDLIIDL